LPTTALSGGVKVIFELANRLTERGGSVDIFSFAGPPKWVSLKAGFLPSREIADIDFAPYDFVLVANAFLLPIVLQHVAASRSILFCQDYESFHHARGNAYADFISDSPTFSEIYKLPVPLISTSRAVQSLIRERVGRESFYLPLGINKAVFAPQPRKPATDLSRVLMVGNYLMPYKGMKDGFAALRQLSGEFRVQLVLVTQESRGRAVFDQLPFPIEIHFCPTEEQMPKIMASCDLYCCTSWYEGLGLPALEAFRCGVPVVSTRTHGVSDYGVDGVNLLLARPNDPQDLCEKLQRLLHDPQLAERMRHEAFKTVETGYDWETSVNTLLGILNEITPTSESLRALDPHALQKLSAALEREGNFTPIKIFRRFQQLAAELGEIEGALVEEEIPTVASLRKVECLRSELRCYLNNEDAEYFAAFKAKYDFCQLILSLKDNPRFGHYLKLILTRRKQREPGTVASFSEIRYPDQQPAT
jgi:glycosyltransferase involved in cell wall biosynthesis